MSTKKIREALELLSCLTDEAMELASEALTEVEAIEKACASMRNAEVFIPDGLGNIRDLDVLFNIAKEST